MKLTVFLKYEISTYSKNFFDFKHFLVQKNRYIFLIWLNHFGSLEIIIDMHSTKYKQNIICLSRKTIRVMSLTEAKYENKIEFKNTLILMGFFPRALNSTRIK
ncbi:hypothetical protein BpHYR1_030482 [Brachionus plicatilis]|uniref:Uncharacterized protein n=1 Tax=Brachionus plicatilis TaxID=10195 RepID=A0A3M7PD92_BRAPC|nr:hypothetical protein BpHYR1_030482 [Brachionus plicatilis]